MKKLCFFQIIKVHATVALNFVNTKAYQHYIIVFGLIHFQNYNSYKLKAKNDYNFSSPQSLKKLSFNKLDQTSTLSLAEVFRFVSFFFFFRPLASDGRDGHGVVRGLHRLRAASEFESFDASSIRAFALRCLLGLLLPVRLQRERHGQSCHQVIAFYFDVFELQFEIQNSISNLSSLNRLMVSPKFILDCPNWI